MGNWGATLKREWAALAQMATWLLTIAGGFLLPPAVGLTKEDSDAWRKFGVFVLTFTVGLVFLASRKWKTRPFGRRWTTAAILFLLLAVGSFVEYQWLCNGRTCFYHGQKVVIGTQLTVQGLAYLQRNPGISCSDLIEDFAGKVDDVWTTDSISRSLVLIGSCYVLALSVSALCILALLQAISIARGSPQG